MRFAWCIFFLSVFLISLDGQSPQGDGSIRYRQALKYYNAAESTDKTDSLALLFFERSIQEMRTEKGAEGFLADARTKSGILYIVQGKPAQALKLFSEVISVRSPDSSLFQALLYSGSIQYDMNRLDSARYYYDRAETIVKRIPNLPDAERLYNKVGVLYFETGDYRNSINYFQRAYDLLQNAQKQSKDLAVNYLNNIAIAHLRLGENNDAIEILERLRLTGISTDGISNNLANAFFATGATREAIALWRSIRQPNQNTLNNLANAYLRIGFVDSARLFLTLASQKSDASRPADRALTNKYAGDIAVHENRFSDALASYQRAINQYLPAFNDTDITHNPTTFNGTINFRQLYEVLVARAALLGRMGSAQVVNALSAYQSVLALTRYAERTYATDDAKIFLKTQTEHTASQAIAIAINAYESTQDTQYLREAFVMAERQKASVLRSVLDERSLTAIPGMPVALLQQENSLRALRSKLELQVSLSGDSIATRQLRARLQSTELAMAEIQHQLDLNPKYSSLRASSDTFNLADIQRDRLTTDEGLISYYFLDSSIACFFVTKTDFGCKIISNAKDISQKLRKLRQLLESDGGTDREALSGLSTSLYSSLVKPVQDAMKTAKHWIIIPHNEIGFLPFELLTDPDSKTMLLHKAAISYNYSASFLPRIDNNNKDSYQVLAFAPFLKAGDDPLMPALVASASEIQGLPGFSATGTEATKERFMVLAPDYAVLHLATHAVASDSNQADTYIAFNANGTTAEHARRLYEQEVYALPLSRVKLVILSACETGKGKLVSGEGVMSLARAFSYAGCQSVITSLWKADDASTAFIMRRLHQNLQEGLRQDEALQRAKIDYLQSDAPARLKSPSFWAHIVLIGDNDALVKPHTNWVWWALASGIIIGLAVWAIKKRVW
jgi:CHAT domain-containing protein